MSAEDFSNFKNKAKEHQMTLDDIHYLLNKDQTAANVATSTKKDMMNQMKNVRSMPTSASGANSQGKTNASPDREVFENILGFDDSVDNLFG
jgi:regulation of enolase protein 1 (concanavalin A-like superfamily)